METKLPEVAKNFYHFCKKCDADRYHVVLAHSGPESAKIQCEVCKAKSTYKLPKAKAARVASPKAAGTRSVNARRSSHKSEYEALLEEHSSHPEIKYTIKGKFEQNQKLNHPKFGLGFVKTSSNERIEVVFADEVKALIHNRP